MSGIASHVLPPTLRRLDSGLPSKQAAGPVDAPRAGAVPRIIGTVLCPSPGEQADACSVPITVNTLRHTTLACFASCSGQPSASCKLETTKNMLAAVDIRSRVCTLHGWASDEGASVGGLLSFGIKSCRGTTDTAVRDKS